MLRIFVDSSVLFSLKCPTDRDHVKAHSLLNKLSKKEVISFISTEVISECVSLTSRRLGKKVAISLLDELRSGSYTIVNCELDTLFEAEAIFREVASKNVSYCDCVSFAVMRRYGILWAFSFDEHFKKQGFKRLGVDGWPK